MLIRHSVLGLCLCLIIGLAVAGCGGRNSDKAGENTRELIVFVSSDAKEVRSKAESYGLKVKTIQSGSAADQLSQALLNAPSSSYFAVINPSQNRFIAGEALPKDIQPARLDALFRSIKQISKTGVEEHQRLRPSKPENARLVFFTDYQCPYCHMMNTVVKSWKEQYGDKLEVEVIHFPLAGHPQAFPAAEAAECARNQGKFEEYQDILFEHQADLSPWYYGRVANQLGLDGDAFSQCVNQHKTRKTVRRDQYFGQYMGVNATPTMVLNGQVLQNESPEEVQAILDEYYAKRDKTKAKAH